ncbi:Hypothetical protein SRAE_2000229700 [Strongyloides ratti]|uniref:Uncharacterized protein n=1 Tax=Strongyloides ratti TaxID=34506 RepID=A0A090LCY2_STRRB|nr:Hypothetical protein SRAE_2000229700 [Strongyloides ratti]CEF67636.1 Hypothetical protein SRAE_2000229700 [Strongyloides ratti]
MDLTNNKTKIINKKLKKPLQFRDKIKLRHLELEPLCCLDSCLIRGGCLTIAVFEVIYISITTILGIYIAYKYQIFYTKFSNTSSITIYLSIIFLYNFISCFFVALMLHGLLSFQKIYLWLHWNFDKISLIFHIFMFSTTFFLLSTKFLKGEFSIENITLLCCFGFQIPLQFWSLSVVKRCSDYFNLLKVLIKLAEQ